MVIKRPCEELGQAEYGHEDASYQGDQEPVGETVEGIAEPEGHQRTQKPRVDGVHGVEQLFVYAQYEGHRAPGHAGHDIGHPHAETAGRDAQVIPERPFRTRGTVVHYLLPRTYLTRGSTSAYRISVIR